MKKFILILIFFGSIFVSVYTFADTPNIRFGLMYFYPPFIWRNALGESYGFDPAIAQAICEQLHKNCELIPMPFYRLFIALEQNEVDAIISAIFITPEREAKYSFTTPYYKSTMSFITMRNNKITDKAFQDKVIGTLKGSIFSDYLKQQYPNSKILLYDIPEDTIGALINGKVNMVLLDTLTAKWWVNNSANQFKLFSTIALPGGGEYGIAVKKGNEILLNELNSALQQILTNGKYQQIIKLYLPSANLGSS